MENYYTNWEREREREYELTPSKVLQFLSHPDELEVKERILMAILLKLGV